MISSDNHKDHKILHQCLPRHVAIIMDGNGRWAKIRGKSSIFGHKAGLESMRRAITFAARHNFNALTLYAFSRENWNRPSEEVSALMQLFSRALESETKNLHKNNVRLRIIGDTCRFCVRLQDLIRRIEDLTCKNKGLTLNIAANYGGRWDIIQGVKELATQVKEGILCPDQINEDILCRHICLKELAPVDLVIRTGGELRISNFLLWQIAYTELFFTNVLWPDFDDIAFEDALDSFSRRERRFGGSTSKDIDVF